MVLTLFLRSYTRALMGLLLDFKNKLKELKELNFLIIDPPLQSLEVKIEHTLN